MNNMICRKVIEVTPNGVTLESVGKQVYIDFAQCAKNFSTENGKVCKCVAARDITKLSFTFYTNPKTGIVFRRSHLAKLIQGKSAADAFLEMLKAILDAGYTTYDLS